MASPDPARTETRRAVAASPDIADTIRRYALGLGFDAVGFAAAAAPVAWAERLGAFLAAGHHGDMGWMQAKAERRADPKALWPAAKSVVVVGLNYSPPGDPLYLIDKQERANISVYARGADYHDVVKQRLKSLGRFMVECFGADVKVFVDTAPVREKPLAQEAGIGWQGKHTNLVSREFGSWLFLGAVYTTLDLSPNPAELDYCGSCRSCIDACPTNAFPAPYKLDARRCISYLTIEHKSHIPLEFRRAIGNRVYGCDDCLAACPWNKFARKSRDAAFLPRVELTAPRLADFVKLDDECFRRVFAQSPIKRVGRDRFVRNVLIGLGNGGDPAMRKLIEPLLRDGSPLVRAMAVWALRQLVDAGSLAPVRDAHLADETDAEVRAEWTN
ncbi:MAG: tRNA epoxyqueuosine(34) reductase QueG [Alphaproteobacteria bacterium]